MPTHTTAAPGMLAELYRIAPAEAIVQLADAIEHATAPRPVVTVQRVEALRGVLPPLETVTRQPE